MKAIIGGTGVYDITEVGFSFREERVKTAYGDVRVDIAKRTDGSEVAFLARHGKGHSLPPHLINYRANMKALKQLGVDEILATCAVGSTRPSFGVGDVVILHDFLDFTKSRTLTYFDGSDGKVGHVVMSDPYCPALIKAFEAAAPVQEITVKGKAVYVCTEGPRFETAAEIRMFAQMGGDVVGMTNIPESVLAKELGMCYAAVGMVSNMCTGVGGEIEGHDLAGALVENKAKVTKAFLSVLLRPEKKTPCRCADAVIFMT